jgi:hypothetical protein
LNGAAIATFVVLFVASGLLRSRSALLIATAALVVATAVKTYRTVVGAKAASPWTASFGFWHPFFVARSAFLVVVAALPAIACFEAAYTSRRHFWRRARARKREGQRVVEQTRCRTDCGFADQRRKFASGTYASLWPGSSGTTTDAIGSATLNNVLIKMHRR